MLIAGDVGGTKTNLALFSEEQGAHTPLAEARFVSADYPCIGDMVNAFRAQIGNPQVDVACFGVPGPVVKRKAKITNLPWVLDCDEIENDTHIPEVHLMNDLEAMASSVPILEPDDLYTIRPGEPEHGGAIAVLAPGTGLGEAFLTWHQGHYVAYPSEGGHARFSPSTDEELELLRYLMKKYYGHVSTERVCSGIGIPNIYAFLRDTGYAKEPDWFAEELMEANDPTPPIMINAMSNDPLPLTRKTLDMFVEILGSEAGDLAMAYMATAGVYIGGGIPPRILDELSSERFWLAYSEKGRFREMMHRVPLHIIINSKAPLLGAAQRGIEALQAHQARLTSNHAVTAAHGD